MSFCCLKRLPEEEAAEGQSELRPISPDPPGPSIPIALHAGYEALSTPRGGCNLLRPLPFCLHCPSHTAVSGQAKSTCASGPLPRPSSPGVLVSLTYSRSPASAPRVQQGCQGPRHLKNNLYSLPPSSPCFSSRQGAECHQTRCQFPPRLPTYLSCIYQLAYCPAPAHFLSPTTLSQILEDSLADKVCPTDRSSQHRCS